MEVVSQILTPQLQLRKISKWFPGVKALSEVDLDVNRGEVLAVCGENGAGKSTLMKVLTGNHTPDEGDIFLHGEKVLINNQKHAQQLGISIVYQEKSLIQKLSVAENIFVSDKPTNRFGLVDYGELYDQADALLESLGLGGIDSRELLINLSAANQQMVEIAKALSQKPEILILDEPTASITDKEVALLFDIIRDLKQQGISIIYISHRMAEIFEIADRIAVLKDGELQGTYPAGSVTKDDLIRTMVGRDIQREIYNSCATDDIVLEVKGLTGRGFQEISFDLRKGEVLALSGLVGAGRTEVARALFGMDQRWSGTVLIDGVEQLINHPSEAIQVGMAYVPEDRKNLGLFLESDVVANIASADLGQVSKKGWISTSAATSLAQSYKGQLNIKTPNLTQKVINLSGGNQQKVVLAKWLAINPKILIVDEPTHGVDVGAKQEIYNILKRLTAEGVAILLISSELPEVLLLGDRILVMCNGEITVELDQKEASEEIILNYASGIETQKTNPIK